MRVEFERWPEIRTTYESWWNHDLGRPLVNIHVLDDAHTIKDRIGPPPALEYRRFTGHYDPAVSPARIIDRYDWEIASRRYVADGFPSTFPNFGAGVVAAMAGCDMVARDDTIWFEPRAVVPPGQLHIPQGTDSPVARKILDFYHEAVAYWQGSVQLGMTDLGGALDVVQSFLPGAGLALAVYDDPEEITRLTAEVHESWWAHFDLFRNAVAKVNPGHTAWTPLLSAQSYYMLQCDFAYMIGPEMFNSFVRPELAASCLRLERPFYHLDGEGQLAHLESLLEIPGLAGVQWIPGDGAPDTRHWPEVYRRIRDSGKLTQIFLDQSESGIDVLDTLADQLGDLSFLAVVGSVSAGAEEEHAHKVLERHGVAW